MINKIVAIQGNHPSKLNPLTDTSVFLANEIQNKKYKRVLTAPAIKHTWKKTSVFGEIYL